MRLTTEIYGLEKQFAFSQSRIEIKCRDHAGTMIEVVDKEDFLREMKKRLYLIK